MLKISLKKAALNHSLSECCPFNFCYAGKETDAGVSLLVCVTLNFISDTVSALSVSSKTCNPNKL
jgi:hypothetical protein